MLPHLAIIGCSMPIGIDILESVHLKMVGMLCAASMANRCDFMIEGNGLSCVNPVYRAVLLSINDIGITKMPFRYASSYLVSKPNGCCFFSENFEDCCDIWLYMSIK